MYRKSPIFISGLFLICLLGFSNPIFAEQPQLLKETSFGSAGQQEAVVLNDNMIFEEQNTLLLANKYVEINMDVLLKETVFEISFLNSGPQTIKVHRVLKRGETDFTVFGTVSGFKFSQATFVINGNKVSANIRFKDKFYHIRWIGGFTHSIAEIDWTSIPEDAPPVGKEELGLDNSKQLDSQDIKRESNASTDDGSSIDILVVYTQAAAAGGDIKSEIQLAVDDLNQAMENTNVNLTFRLVHTEMVDYYETGIALTDLTRLQNPNDGFMDGVVDLRDIYGADLVALVTESMNQWAGLGSLNTPPLSDQLAFHVAVRNSFSYGTFAHEVGHNLGMHHEIAQSPEDGAYSYSHGWVDPAFEFKTIMSYGTECTSYCPGINYYSAPNSSGIQYNSKDIGDANADNRQTVINTKLGISQFRQSKSSSQLSSDEDTQKGCFIATAAYGSYLDPSVQSLRDFRDQYLEPYAWGRFIMKMYYTYSPPLAKIISQNEILRGGSRLLLTPIVIAVSEPIVFLSGFLAFILLIRFRHFKWKGGKQ